MGREPVGREPVGGGSDDPVGGAPVGLGSANATAAMARESTAAIIMDGIEEMGWLEMRLGAERWKMSVYTRVFREEQWMQLAPCTRPASSKKFAANFEKAKKKKMNPR